MPKLLALFMERGAPSGGACGYLLTTPGLPTASGSFDNADADRRLPFLFSVSSSTSWKFARNDHDKLTPRQRGIKKRTPRTGWRSDYQSAWKPRKEWKLTVTYLDLQVICSRSVLISLKATLPRAWPLFDCLGLAVAIVAGDKLVSAKGFGVQKRQRARRHPYYLPDQFGDQGLSCYYARDRGKFRWDLWP
jgi:hypothetical protein